jgi:Flavin reductase like domain
MDVKRERLGREEPGSVLRGSPITITTGVTVAGRVANGAADPRFDLVRETPLVEGALAHFVARVERSYWGGDHSLFLGRVEYARQHPGTPLLFHGGRYERLGNASGA